MTIEIQTFLGVKIVTFITARNNTEWVLCHYFFHQKCLSDI